MAAPLTISQATVVAVNEELRLATRRILQERDTHLRLRIADLMGLDQPANVNRLALRLTEDQHGHATIEANQRPSSAWYRATGPNFHEPAVATGGTLTTNGKFAAIGGGGFGTSEAPVRVAKDGNFRVLPQAEWQCGFSFAAPPSGNVTVEVGLLTHSTGSAQASVYPVIRTGTVLGQGTVVFGDDSVANRASAANAWATKVHNVTGLTPAADYNVQIYWFGAVHSFPTLPELYYVDQRYVLARSA